MLGQDRIRFTEFRGKEIVYLGFIQYVSKFGTQEVPSCLSVSPQILKDIPPSLGRKQLITEPNLIVTICIMGTITPISQSWCDT